VRVPRDLSTATPPRPRRRRARWWILAAVVVLIILIASLRTLADIYTDGLWFSSVGYHNVFSTLLVIKLGLFGVFGAIFFVVMWVNLVVCDRVAGDEDAAGAPQPDELVRRYQQHVRPYAGRIYVALAFVMALIAASGTIGEWQNWLLFRHGGNFGVKDPQFGKDVGFYVFKLPFLNFIVDWALAIFIVVLIVSVIFHYLNGGIVPQRGLPRVRPAVKAHLSVLGAVIALIKAAGYVLQRWGEVNAQDGYVNGAGYTDVHARLPAQLLLIVVSIFAAAILLFNIRRQGWTLPVLAVGIWAFVALVVGVIYPALLQTLKVTPAQASLEAPYIKRNIEATRAAYGLEHVKVKTFQATTSNTKATVDEATQTLDNIRLWDPDGTITVQAFSRQQAIRSYYAFSPLSVDRYTVNGQMTPVLIGVREISPNLPSTSWVNQHLQFTHGEGAVVALANQAQSNGNPVYGIKDVPPTSKSGLPKVTQPNVYFATGENGYVVADTKQLEVDYQRGEGGNVESHYGGNGGVQLTSFFKRAAFALRLGDFNLLISDQITNRSRIMFVRDPVQMAEKAAPFLTFNQSPYAVVTKKGQIDWIVDGYTTTNQYPYSQNADTQQVADGSSLPGSYNYVRNSVKVVINAYSGQMTFYDADPSDPILRAYEAAFPGMFTPLSKMSPVLQAHLRYPPDLFSIQSAIFGRYHLISPAAFYAASNAWQLSPTAGVSQDLQVKNLTNQQGQIVGTLAARMAPLYQVTALPGSQTQSFTVTDAYVPASESSASGANNPNLSAFMVGTSDPGDYGQLTVYEVPQSKPGPANADSYIQANKTVSSDITLLDQHGSEVLLGNTLMIPVGQSIIYLRPLYVAASSNPQPQLTDVIGVIGQRVVIEPTVSQTLSQLLQTTVSTTGGSQGPPPTAPITTGSGTIPGQVAKDLAQAQSDYSAALLALQAGNLGQYQSEITAMNNEVLAAQSALKAAAAVTPKSTPTTTTTTTPGRAKNKNKTTGGTSTTTSTTASTSPTGTEPKSTTTTTLASAAGPGP
jgi:hypothetical protein